METATIVIPLAYLLLTGLLLWGVIWSKGRWGYKLAAIVIVPAFAIAVWSALGSYRGWPTTEEPPDRAQFHWGVVREPDAQSGDKGAIYLWLSPGKSSKKDDPSVLEYASRKGEPRAYARPYSRRLHEEVESGRQMVRDGKRVGMQRGRVGQKGKGQSDGGAQGQGGPDGGAPAQPPSNERGENYGDHDQEFRVYELPPPAPPTQRE